MIRIVLFGDGLWAAQTLERLHVAGHTIAAVVGRTQPSDPSLAEAARSIGAAWLQPATINAAKSLSAVAEFRPDLILSISYNQILRQPILGLPPLGAINVHAGKLPFYRGRNVINWAIINGEREIGVTVHYMDEGIDTGDIILQRTLPIEWTDTYGDVLGRVVESIPGLALEAVELIASNRVQRQPQSKIGTYFAGRGEGDEWLDWADSSRNLHNKIRAITRPGPGARTLLGDEVVTIWKAFYDPKWPNYLATPGQVVGRSDDGAIVKTGDSTIVVQEVQVGAGACSRPHWPIGTRLGYFAV